MRFSSSCGAWIVGLALFLGVSGVIGGGVGMEAVGASVAVLVGSIYPDANVGCPADLDDGACIEVISDGWYTGVSS